MSGSVIAPITSSPCCGFGSKFAAQNKNGSGKYREVTTAKLVDIGIGIGVGIGMLWYWCGYGYGLGIGMCMRMGMVWYVMYVCMY